MQILLISNYFEPDGGAAALRLSRLARRLQQNGHQVTVLTSLPHYPGGRVLPPYAGRWQVIENRDGLRVIQVWLWATPSPRISRKLLSQISFMFDALLVGRKLPAPDVVLIEAQPIFSGLAGALLARFKRRPYVLNVSDLWPDHLLSVGALKASHPVYKTARFLVNRLYKGAAGIVAMSPAWAAAIQGQIGQSQSDKVHVVYNGVDLEKYSPQTDPSPIQKRLKLDGRKLISFIGTFATQYDFETLLRAFQHFAGRDDLCFALIGAGSQADFITEWLATQPIPNLIRLDWLSPEETRAAWAASYLSCWALGAHPLYSGTIPAKLYEALACGVPTLAAVEGVTAELIQKSKAGLSVPTGDVAGLIAGLERLIEDEALHSQYSRAARAYAEKHFAAAQIAAQYEMILQAALLSP